MEIIKQNIKKTRPSIKENSIEVYLRNIIKFMKIANKNAHNIYDYLIKSADEVIKAVKDEQLSLSMKKNLFSAKKYPKNIPKIEAIINATKLTYKERSIMSHKFLSNDIIKNKEFRKISSIFILK